ncbi:MAG TPA: SigE family RNA polymerase sigma factor [Acidimicrobiales bacterium]|jgi:RNA polymerase sigma-70 factor (sigma-E family)
MPNPPATYDELFPDLYPLAYRVAFKILGDRGDAEDVAQEALARALVRWARVGDRPHGWVTRVAANLAIDRYRRRRRSTLTQTQLGSLSVVDPLLVERMDLADALRRLPRRQREVVVLRYLLDWSEFDVATALGCTPGTVKRHAFRGLAALRTRLETPMQGDDDVRAS